MRFLDDQVFRVKTVVSPPPAFHAVLVSSWLACVAATSGLASDWPRWLGPTRDGHAAPDAPAVRTLPKELKPAWKLSIGGGFSAPIVSGNKLIYLDEQNGKETVHLCDAATGQERWRVAFADSFGDEWGSGPRSTPFVDGDRLYVQSCNGHFGCLSLADGQMLWRVNFADFGIKFLGSKSREGTASRRGNNGCGIVDGERVFVPVGSTNGATIVCFDKVTGRELWRALNDESAYSSVVIGTLGGVKQVVALTGDALNGLDWSSGKPLWRVPLKTAAKRHAATPVLLGGDRVVVNSHTFGLLCFKVVSSAGGPQIAPAWTNKTLKINLSTPVLVGGFLYCQGANKDYVCVEAATGALKWSQPGFGRGTKDNASTIVVGDRLLVLTEPGELVLLAAESARCRELGRLQVCGSTWTFPAYAEGRLFVRDPRELICVEVTR